MIYYANLIKLTNEHDMYDLYKDDPVRYVEEVKYLFEDGDPPKDRIKKFDGHDSSTFPYNQKKELDIYQLILVSVIAPYDDIRKIIKKNNLLQYSLLLQYLLYLYF